MSRCVRWFVATALCILSFTQPNAGGLFGGGQSTVIALTDVPSRKIFQRDAGLSTGPVSLSGTYTGPACAVQGQIVAASDGSVIVDWMTVAASPSGGTWTGSVTGLTYGGAYKAKARCASFLSPTVSGSNSFYMGDVWIGDGQSNMSNMIRQQNTPPASNAATAWFNGTNWVAPQGNGAIAMLNFVNDQTGIPQGIVDGSHGGAGIAALLPGAITGYYEALIVDLTNATGGKSRGMLLGLGESDGFAGTSSATFISGVNTLWADLAAVVGRTAAQFPLIVCSLARTTEPTITDAHWAAMQSALYTLGSQTNAFYSHSNMDVDPILTDYHYPTYTNDGRRFGQALANFVYSTQANPANWFVTSMTAVDPLTTDFTLVHKLGTDFTPTGVNAITGFQVSDDAASWINGTCTRNSVTVIRCNHVSIGSSPRYGRYQYGVSPVITGIVLDNSSLAVPLNLTPVNLVTPYLLNRDLGAANDNTPAFMDKAA